MYEIAPTKIRVTDGAWEWLVQNARRYGYVTARERAYGMCWFIGELAQHRFTDTRPDYMTGTDQWYEGIDMPRQRLIALDALTLARLVACGREHHIEPFTRQRPVTNGLRAHVRRTRTKTYTAPTLASAVLEAIGLRWLTPRSDIAYAPNALRVNPMEGILAGRKRYHTHSAVG